MNFIKRLEQLEEQIKPDPVPVVDPEPLTPEEAAAVLACRLLDGIAAIDAGTIVLVPGLYWYPGAVDCDSRLLAMENKPGYAPQLEIGSPADYLQRFERVAWDSMGMPASWPRDLAELRAWLVEQLEEIEQGEP